MWVQLMAALVILASPALAQRGVIESVTPNAGTIETGQPLGLTVRGVNPCGAVEIDPGDGNVQVHPISQLPATVTITLQKPGPYTIRAKGQGNCDGTASVAVRAVGRDLTTSQPPEDPSRAEPRRQEEVPLTARPVVVTVRATDPWTDTGIRVFAGDIVRLEAAGEVAFAPRMAVGPQGASTARVDGAPFPERPAGALIARIGDDSDPIFVGAADRTFRAVRSGLLWLGINDDQHADNSGAFTVHVSDAGEDRRAGRRQPGTRTGAGSAVPTQWDVRVPAVDTWTDTGVMLAAGDILHLEASGVVHLSQNARDSADPTGSRTRLAPGAVFPDRPAGGLIARIGRGEPIYVGARQQTIRVTEDGRLLLGVNDDHMADNGGAFEVRIAVSSPRR